MYFRLRAFGLSVFPWPRELSRNVGEGIIKEMNVFPVATVRPYTVVFFQWPRPLIAAKFQPEAQPTRSGL